jgi:hypothetical protein
MSQHVPAEQVEVKLQTASQDYDCDFCPEPILDETKYVRVGLVVNKGRRGPLPSLAGPGRLEKYHPSCYTVLTGEVVHG